MDPQQRLLLEHGYEALHGAALRRESLLSSGTSVFLGIWASEFAAVLGGTDAAHGVYAITATTCSVAVGRLSFVLGLHGPCVSFDTACSSSLVAAHGGLSALQRRECMAAVIAGVNMACSRRAGAHAALTAEQTGMLEARRAALRRHRQRRAHTLRAACPAARCGRTGGARA
eukprot:1734539-Prymnesium_polylepis.1